MPGLVLKLRPGERIMVNGVVMENGDRRSKLTVLTPNSQILRLRDAIHPDEADTPVKRVIYIVQLVLAGEAEPNHAKQQIGTGIDQLSQVFLNDQALGHLLRAQEHLEADRLYLTLKELKALMPLEQQLLDIAEQRQHRTPSMARLS